MCSSCTLTASALAALPAVFFAAQMIFRLVYYESWVPNTCHVKMASSPQRVQEGWEYLTGAALPLLSLLIPALFAVGVACFDRSVRPRFALILSLAAAWSVYVVIIGKDVFPARRQIVPLIALLALLWSHTMDWAMSSGARWRIGACLVTPALLA